MTITPQPREGLLVDGVVPTQSFQGGACYWDPHPQQIIRESLGHFLPDAEYGAKGVVFKKVESQREVLCTSKPLGNRRIPKRQLQDLCDSVLEFQKKEKDPRTTDNAREIIRKFRLPDPVRDRQFYRLTGPWWNRRLHILWGCQSEGVPAERAITSLVAKNPLNYPALTLLLLLLLAGLAFYFWPRNAQPPIANLLLDRVEETNRTAIVSDGGSKAMRGKLRHWLLDWGDGDRESLTNAPSGLRHVFGSNTTYTVGLVCVDSHSKTSALSLVTIHFAVPASGTNGPVPGAGTNFQPIAGTGLTDLVAPSNQIAGIGTNPGPSVSSNGETIAIINSLTNSAKATNSQSSSPAPVIGNGAPARDGIVVMQPPSPQSVPQSVNGIGNDKTGTKSAPTNSGAKQSASPVGENTGPSDQIARNGVIPPRNENGTAPGQTKVPEKTDPGTPSKVNPTVAGSPNGQQPSNGNPDPKPGQSTSPDKNAPLNQNDGSAKPGTEAKPNQGNKSSDVVSKPAVIGDPKQNGDASTKPTTGSSPGDLASDRPTSISGNDAPNTSTQPKISPQPNGNKSRANTPRPNPLDHAAPRMIKEMEEQRKNPYPATPPQQGQNGGAAPRPAASVVEDLQVGVKILKEELIPGNKMRVRLGATYQGNVVDGTTRWSIDNAPVASGQRIQQELAPGTYTVGVSVTDRAGNQHLTESALTVNIEEKQTGKVQLKPLKK